MRWLPRYLTVLTLTLLLPHCGGGSTGSEPKTADNGGAEDGAERSADDDDGDAAESNAASSVEEDAKGPSCDDGTCSVCGNGICPAGWYCDESAPGGAACAWLKECADKPSCGCVTRVLGAGCKCRDESGLKVSCN